MTNFSLTVNKGEIFCILGLNGAGKTTAVKLALNLLFPDSGEIEVLGEKPSPEVISRVGYVSENPYLFPYLTGRELFNLMEDPEETRNLWFDAMHRALRNELHIQLLHKIMETDNSLPRQLGRA